MGVVLLTTCGCGPLPTTCVWPYINYLWAWSSTKYLCVWSYQLPVGVVFYQLPMGMVLYQLCMGVVLYQLPVAWVQSSTKYLWVWSSMGRTDGYHKQVCTRYYVGIHWMGHIYLCNQAPRLNVDWVNVMQDMASSLVKWQLPYRPE